MEYTNERKETIIQMKKVHGKNIVRKVLRAKLEGIRAVKSSTSAQPVKASTSTQHVQAKPEPELEESGSRESEETVLPEAVRMADFKTLVVNQFGIDKEDINKVSFSGAATKYDILKMIAREMWRTNDQDKYINDVTFKDEEGKIRFKEKKLLSEYYTSLMKPEVKK